jgi:hypothetical protein
MQLVRIEGYLYPFGKETFAVVRSVSIQCELRIPFFARDAEVKVLHGRTTAGGDPKTEGSADDSESEERLWLPRRCGACREGEKRGDADGGTALRQAPLCDGSHLQSKSLLKRLFDFASKCNVFPAATINRTAL